MIGSSCRRRALSPSASAADNTAFRVNHLPVRIRRLRRLEILGQRQHRAPALPVSVTRPVFAFTPMNGLLVRPCAAVRPSPPLPRSSSKPRLAANASPSSDRLPALKSVPHCSVLLDVAPTVRRSFLPASMTGDARKVSGTRFHYGGERNRHQDTQRRRPRPRRLRDGDRGPWTGPKTEDDEI